MVLMVYIDLVEIFDIPSRAKALDDVITVKELSFLFV